MCDFFNDFSEVLNPTTILNALNPNDYGEESVNPKTFYQVNISLNSFDVKPKMLS